MEILSWQESTMAKNSLVVITACNTCCLAVIFKGINFSSSETLGHESQRLSKCLESQAVPREGQRGASRGQPRSFSVAKVLSNLVATLFHLVWFKGSTTFGTLRRQPQAFLGKVDDPHFCFHVKMLRERLSNN